MFYVDGYQTFLQNAANEMITMSQKYCFIIVFQI